MSCERSSENADKQTGNRTGLLSWWHRLRCDVCRRTFAVDRMIERGSAQMRATVAPPDSLARVLAAVGCAPSSQFYASDRATREALARSLALVGIGIFVTALATPQYPDSALFGGSQFTLKSAAGAAGFAALLGLFWYLKPVAAALLEGVPGLISYRKVCLIASAAGAAILWMVPLLNGHVSPPAAIALGIGLNAVLALASTILGGYLVEQAQRIGASGRLGAFHQAAGHLAGMAAPLLGFGAGHFVAPPVAATLLLGFGAVAAFLFPGSALVVHRPEGIKAQLTAIKQARELWQVALMLVLVVLPSNFDSLLHSQQVERGFTDAQHTQLNSIAQAATLVAILAYSVLCKRVRLQSLLPAGIIGNAVGTLLYLGYGDPIGFPTAIAIEILNGLAAALIMVTLFDLAVRAVPRQCAYLGYAILMSVHNLALSMSNVVTASLRLPFPSVVMLSALCSTFALAVVVRLPSALISRREGEPGSGSLPALPAV